MNLKILSTYLKCLMEVLCVSRLGIPYTAKRYFLICQKEFQSEYDFICIYLLQYDTYCDSKCDVKVLSR